MILTQENRKNLTIIFLSANLSTTTGLRLNPIFRSERPATNRLRHGTGRPHLTVSYTAPVDLI